MLVKQRLYTKILMIAAFAGVAVLLTSINASGAQNGTGTANTMRVAPVRTDLSMNPGEKKTVKVTVTNPANFDVTVRPVQNDFIAGDENGTPALILEENEFAPTRSLKRFMTPLENVAIPAGKSKTVNVEINVPSGAEAGGYFGAIRFAPVSPADGGQVNLSTSVASLILVRVNGEVPERLTMTDFAVQQNGATGTFFTDSSDITAFVRFKNEGGVQLGPLGKISVKKGDQVVYETDFNNKDQRDMILPDSARRWSIPVNELDGFGQYTVTATFTYGSNNQTVEVTKSFWIIPTAMIIGVIVALLLLIGGIVWLVYYLRNRKKGMSLNSRR